MVFIVKFKVEKKFQTFSNFLLTSVLGHGKVNSVLETGVVNVGSEKKIKKSFKKELTSESCDGNMNV